jgi:hypothetical protein
MRGWSPSLFIKRRPGASAFPPDFDAATCEVQALFRIREWGEP